MHMHVRGEQSLSNLLKFSDSTQPPVHNELISAIKPSVQLDLVSGAIFRRT